MGKSKGSETLTLQSKRAGEPRAFKVVAVLVVSFGWREADPIREYAREMRFSIVLRLNGKSESKPRNL